MLWSERRKGRCSQGRKREGHTRKKGERRWGRAGGGGAPSETPPSLSPPSSKEDGSPLTSPRSATRAPCPSLWEPLHKGVAKTLGGQESGATLDLGFQPPTSTHLGYLGQPAAPRPPQPRVLICKIRELICNDLLALSRSLSQPGLLESESTFSSTLGNKFDPNPHLTHEERRLRT